MHATAVMTELDEIITEIDDGDKVHARLKALGLSHKARGINATFFLV